MALFLGRRPKLALDGGSEANFSQPDAGAAFSVGTFHRRIKRSWNIGYRFGSLARRRSAARLAKTGLKKSRLARYMAQGYTGAFDAHWQSQVNRLRWALNDIHIFLHHISSAFKSLKISRLNSVLVIFILVLLIVTSQFYSIAMELYLDGERVGYVLSEQDFDDAAKTVEEEAAYYLDRPYKLVVVPRYNFSFVRRNQILDTADLESVLYKKINEVQDMYVLKVDGEIVGAYKYRSAIDEILDERLDAFMPEHSEDVRAEFVKKVEVSFSPVDLSYNKTPAELKELVNSYIDEEQIHIVKEGDTLDSIRRQYGVTLDAIKKLNPGITDDDLTPGEELLVATEIPFLPVQMVARETYTEALPFEIEKRNSDSLYKNQSDVLVEGSEGEALVTADVTYLNGVETDRHVTDRVVIKEPVKQVVLIGTKTPPPRAPTGNYIRPYKGIITSGYGWRMWGNSREFHTGVDFAGPTGSTVVAADGGTVVFAGWMGNYGRCVIISHGNGVETLYGHNSKLVVEKGQKVAQGEKISEIGTTGRTTGPHVHFEVRVNGSDVDPFGYID